MWRYETMLQAWLSHLTGPHELGCECVRFDANELVKEEFGLRWFCIWKLKLKYLIQLRLWQIFKSKIFSQGVLKDFAGRGEAIWETKDISRNLRRISAGFPLFIFFLSQSILFSCLGLWFGLSAIGLYDLTVPYVNNRLKSFKKN